MFVGSLFFIFFNAFLDTMDEVFLLTNIELSSEYEEKFSKDHFSFGSDNFHFKIYVYNLTPYSTVAVSCQRTVRFKNFPIF